MATGVRIAHATARNARFTIVEKDRPYTKPYQCSPPEFGGCGVVHVFKTHHLNLDETGSCIISLELYEKIKGLLTANGFSNMSEIKKPPTMTIGLATKVPGMGDWGNIPIIEGKG